MSPDRWKKEQARRAVFNSELPRLCQVHVALDSVEAAISLHSLECACGVQSFTHHSMFGKVKLDVLLFVEGSVRSLGIHSFLIFFSQFELFC